MFRAKLACAAGALMIGLSPLGVSAAELTLWHSWSNESEMRALNTIVDAFIAQGHTVRTASVPHETAGESPLVSLFVAGTPPNVFIAAEAGFFRDLNAQGQGQEVGTLFDEIGATEAFPETVLKAITIDGQVMKIPVGVHIDGMVYYNMEVAKAAGVDPASWMSLEDMWADRQKVEDAGYTFIAIGGNTFQAGYTFHPMLAAIAGPDVYNKFYGDPDDAIIDDPGVRATIETMGEIFRQTDEGWVNRSWNDTTNTVIAGNALMQIHGDWMKGQWKANGKEPGVDFGCINIPGTKALSVTVDSFGILGGVDEETLKAELDFASLVVDPAINAEFALYKGSSPVRLDVPEDHLDICNELVLESLGKPDYSVLNTFYVADLDWQNSVWNALFAYQSDPNMTVDDVIARLKSERSAVFD